MSYVTWMSLSAVCRRPSPKLFLQCLTLLCIYQRLHRNVCMWAAQSPLTGTPADSTCAKHMRQQCNWLRVVLYNELLHDTTLKVW